MMLHLVEHDLSGATLWRRKISHENLPGENLQVLKGRLPLDGTIQPLRMQGISGVETVADWQYVAPGVATVGWHDATGSLAGGLLLLGILPLADRQAIRSYAGGLREMVSAPDLPWLSVLSELRQRPLVILLRDGCQEEPSWLWHVRQAAVCLLARFALDVQASLKEKGVPW
jgi:hypothetical protein